MAQDSSCPSPLDQSTTSSFSPHQKSGSVWQYKPWWCQPWSILLTGLSIIGGSWYVLKIGWVTALVALPVGSWMGFFVLVYPRLADHLNTGDRP